MEELVGLVLGGVLGCIVLIAVWRALVKEIAAGVKGIAASAVAQGPVPQAVPAAAAQAAVAPAAQSSINPGQLPPAATAASPNDSPLKSPPKSHPAAFAITSGGVACLEPWPPKPATQAAPKPAKPVPLCPGCGRKLPAKGICLYCGEGQGE